MLSNSEATGLVNEKKGTDILHTKNITGIICSSCVVLVLLNIASTVVALLVEGKWCIRDGAIISVLLYMSMWSFLMTVLSDPGYVPIGARPLGKTIAAGAPLALCAICQTYKPTFAHHDGVSNRCVSRMDHFCQWTNNAVGAKNQKYFLLFCFYLNVTSTYSVIIFVINLVLCSNIICIEIPLNQIILVRTMAVLMIVCLLFTSTVLVSQIYGIWTGLGLIDRMKLTKSGGPLPLKQPLQITHIFGNDWYFWFLPVSPYFKDPETVFNYYYVEDDQEQ